MRGRAIPYSAEELAWLEENCKLVISEYAAAFNKQFGRDVNPKNLHAMRKRRGWSTGRTGQFPKGNVPYNAGKPHPARGRSAETQFKKGQRTGRAAANYKPIGTERLSRDGYWERKIHDGLPMQSRWRLVHLVRWEEINGPVPEGMCLKSIDGDRTNTEPSNWALISRASLPSLGGGRHGIAYDSAPAELKPAIMAIAQLKQARRAKRGARIQKEQA